MRRLVFLLEEKSLRVFLEELLPRLVPDTDYLLLAHEGKTDLEKSMTRKIRGWGEPNVSFIVVRDQDRASCYVTKDRLAALCADAGRPDSLIRIVCSELESWILGDLDALAAAFDDAKLAKLKGKAKYRDPDKLSSATQVVRRLVPSYQKVSGARAVAKHMVPERNTSHSFQVFLAGVRRIAGTTSS